LPDPILLDGSSLPAEKRPETGMIGDFELPGDENAARNGKVGGGTPPPQGGGGGQRGGAQAQMPTSLPAGAAGGGAAGAQASENAQAGGGAAGQQGQSGSQAQGAMQGGAGASGGISDPNGAAGGIQVAQLDTNGLSGESGAPDGNPAKPQAVAIGDKAMQIKTAPNASGAVGAQSPAGNTQQMETAIGGKGGGGSSSRGGGNAAERGRAMPAGL